MKYRALTFLELFLSLGPMSQCFRTYLSMVNSKTRIQAKSSFTYFTLKNLVAELFCLALHMQHCKHDLATAQCLNWNPSSCNTWLLRGFGFGLVVDWWWGFLDFISKKFWTKTRWNFLWSICLLQDDKMI